MITSTMGTRDERDFLGAFSSAQEAIDQAKQIVDRSLRWERLQATDPNNAEELYDRYKDFGDDPFIISDGSKLQIFCLDLC